MPARPATVSARQGGEARRVPGRPCGGLVLRAHPGRTQMRRPVGDVTRRGGASLESSSASGQTPAPRPGRGDGSADERLDDVQKK